MAEVLFPDRVRCVSCRKNLTEDNVLSGKFCSFACGNFSAPAKSVDEAPRGCKRMLDGVWSYKKRYSSVASVPRKYQDDPASNIYECENCHRFHIGHSRPDVSHNPLKDDLSAVVKDPVVLGETIRKYREALGLDKRVLAKSLKIPAVRITELEAGDKSVSLRVAFLVLDALRLRVSVSGRAPHKR